jgi:hypothetical protein
MQTSRVKGTCRWVFGEAVGAMITAANVMTYKAHMGGEPVVLVSKKIKSEYAS